MNGLKHILALDLGEKRIGVALASYQTKLPHPLVTLSNDDDLVKKLLQIIKENNVDKIIVGLPRSLDGNSTAQTETIKKMASKLDSALKVAIQFQDEALSSVRAKEDIERLRGQSYHKEEVDKLAACYILEDYLADQ